jgi:tetratricopeptide (TPR) repeat protein
LFVFSLAGCAASINAHNAQSYARNASLAARQGDWDTARRFWAGAVVNSSLAHADKRYQAVMNYEYARSLGVTCFYDLAQEYFDKSYAMDKETNGPIYMSSFELARMHVAKGDNKRAVTYFERAFEEGQAAGLEMRDPIGFANMIDEYAKSLEALGETRAAEGRRRAASAIREANKNAKTKTDLTPYGTQCVKQQS